jgi:hypothetical protein
MRDGIEEGRVKALMAFNFGYYRATVGSQGWETIMLEEMWLKTGVSMSSCASVWVQTIWWSLLDVSEEIELGNVRVSRAW